MTGAQAAGKLPEYAGREVWRGVVKYGAVPWFCAIADAGHPGTFAWRWMPYMPDGIGGIGAWSILSCVEPTSAVFATALQEQQAEASIFADAASRLIASLGEYVRQSMTFNPEWRDGIDAIEAALLARRKREHQNKPQTDPDAPA